MADGALELQIPQEFFETLKEIKDNTSVSKEKAEASLKNSVRTENFKNPDKLETTKMSPVYPKSSQDMLAWQLVGQHIFSGGVKELEKFIPKIIPPQLPAATEPNWVNVGRDIFRGGTGTLIDSFKDYDKSKEYAKKATFDNIVRTPEVVKEQEKQDLAPSTKSWIDQLFMSVAAAILAAGIAFGNHPFGQIVESVAYLPNFLKQTFFSSKWMTNIFAKIIRITNIIAQPFMSLAKTLDSLGEWAKPVANWMRTVGKTVGNLGKVLSSTAIKIGSRFISVFRRLPFIGAVVGFYQSYLKYEKGDIAGGTLELVAALLGLIPFPGFTYIAIGLNLAQGLMDYAGIENGSEMLLHGLSGMKNTFISLLAKYGTKIFAPLRFVVKKLPLIGSLVSFAEAYQEFSNGNWIKGLLHIGSGIASYFPGLGTAIAIGLDIINGLVDQDGGGSAIGSFVSHGLKFLVNGRWGRMIKSFILKFGVKVFKFVSIGLKKIPFVGAIFSAYSAYQNFSKGNWLKGILDIGAGVASFFPGIGTAIAVGLDIINAFIGDNEEDEGEEESKANKLLESGKGAGEEAKADMDKAGSDILGTIGEFVLNTVFLPLRIAWTSVSMIGDFIAGLFTSSAEPDTSGLDNEAAEAKEAAAKTKDIGLSIIDLSIGLLKNVLWPITGMFNLVTGIFDFVSNAKDIISAQGEAMLKEASDIVGKATEIGTDIAKAGADTLKTGALSVVPAVVTKMTEMEYAVNNTVSGFVDTVSGWFSSEDESKKKADNISKPVKSNIAPVKKAEDAAASVSDSTDRIIAATADSLDNIQSNMGEIAMLIGNINMPQKPLLQALTDMVNYNKAINVKKDIMTSVDTRVEMQHKAFVNNTNANGSKLDMLIDKMDKLIDTVREKPVAFADMRTSIVNNSSAMPMTRMSTGDVRTNYKNLG